MKIEIQVPEKMVQSGSSLIRSIQNNDAPILDLFVRESIQNSLDAAKQDSTYVNVDFFIREFNSLRLNKIFNGLTEELNNKFPKENYKCIAVRDSNTVGLTGELDFNKIKNNNYGNVNKLIYSIGKPQEKNGAGGSWGLGKTVYYRVGIGLVIFYSRIRLENGEYQSRLAATFVEDELDKKSIIPGYKNKSKCGIAWWGAEVYDEETGKIEENKTQPTTDEGEIAEILKVLGIPEYKEEETGTTIIIPYVNEKRLLNVRDSNGTKGKWTESMDEYLKISIQRWYGPRLTNKNYPYGCYLNASVNNMVLSVDNMEWAFKIIQYLYNFAIGKKSSINGIEFKKEDIKLRGVLEKETAGTIAYAKIPQKFFSQKYSGEECNLFLYYNCENGEDEFNRPIICFTRKPGMIVSYETVGKWVDGIEKTDKDCYVIGIFVLNSLNTLKKIYKISLEEYIRGSELADHSSWGDVPIKNENPGIVRKIQGHITKKIAKEFEKENVTENVQNTQLGNRIGELIMPRFGTGNNITKENPGKHSGNGTLPKNNMFDILYDKVEYYSDSIMIPVECVIGDETMGLKVELGIDSESGIITYEEWTDRFGIKEYPFEIEKITVNYTYDGTETVLDIEKITDTDIQLLYKEEDMKKVIYGVNFENKSKKILKMTVNFKVLIKSRALNLNFKENWRYR